MFVESERDQVVITAKRLDTEERVETSVEVDVPGSEAGRTIQLIELVRDRYPQAEFRSYADDAASFLAHKLLVVAVYKQVATRSRGRADAEQDGGSQSQLFAP